MKKFYLILIIINIIASINSIEQVNIKTFFTDEDLTKINNGQLISRMCFKYDPNKENSDTKINIPETKYNNDDKYSDYEVVVDEKGFIPYELNNESKLNFYNTLNAYSKLKGMKYYSRRDEKVLELVYECYRVESLSRKKFNDNNYTEIKQKTTGMFLQEDNKFGKLTYRSDVYNDGDNFVLINTNLEPIKIKGLITASDIEDLKIFTFFIYDKNKKGFYYYSVMVVRVRQDFVLKQGIFGPTAFSNRLRASSVHLAKLLGLDWTDKLNAWKGIYDNYKK